MRAENGPAYDLLQVELCGQSLLRALIGLFQIRHELSALGYHLKESSARMEVLAVFFEMRGKFLDSFGKKRDLVLGRSGILIVPLYSLGNLFLLLMRERHRRSIGGMLVSLAAKPIYARSLVINTR